MGKECINGDIVVYFESPIDLTADSFDLSEFRPEHAGIIGRLQTKAKDGKYLLHAASGTESTGFSFQGVRASSLPIGKFTQQILIFRINDETLRNHFVEVSEAYGKRVREQELRSAVKHQSSSYHYLATPLWSFDPDRTKPKESEKLEAWGLYRNIRAYLRYMENTQPISKNWGLECSQFVAYCYLIAKIKTIFPDGLPVSIANVMDQINDERKKFSPVDTLLDKLMNEVKVELGKIGLTESMPVLCTHVKSMNLEKFCIQSLGLPLVKEGTPVDIAVPELNIQPYANFDVTPQGYLNVDAESNPSIEEAQAKSSISVKNNL